MTRVFPREEMRVIEQERERKTEESEEKATVGIPEEDIRNTRRCRSCRVEVIATVVP